MSDLPSLSFSVSANGKARPAFRDLGKPGLFSRILSRRILAEIVDLTIIGALSIAALAALAMASLFSFGMLSVPAVAITLSVPALYHLYFAANRSGVTPGRALLWLELRTQDGALPSTGLVLLRTALFYASVTVLSPLVLLVPLFNDQRRALHDYLTGTIVVNTPAIGAANCGDQGLRQG